MQNKIKMITAWTALGAGILMAALFFATSIQRNQMLVDNGETTAVVNGSLKDLLGQNYSTINDPALDKAVRKFSEGPYVAQTWLLDTQKMVYMIGSGEKGKTQSADLKATQTIKNILAAIPQGEINPSQETMLILSSALQAEGDHGDVYHYRVEKINNSDGKLIGYLGVVYDRSPSVGGTPDIFYILSLVGLVISLLVYWLSLPVWTWMDARQRGEKAWVWCLFTVMGNLAALIAYLLVRLPVQHPLKQTTL